MSLLIAVLLFGVFSALAFNGLFNLLESRFYNPFVDELSPATMKIVLLASFFLTTFLIIFLLFNLKPDPLVVIQNRLKQLQISLIEQFYERKSEADWTRWLRELEQRREEVRALLKRGVKADGKIADSRIADMDILIDKSWDELLTMLGSRRITILDEEKIAQVLQKLLEARTGVPLQPSGSSSTTDKSAVETENIELAEELEILEELDEPETVDDELHDGTKFDGTEFDGAKFQEELEIVSPFSTMVFDSSPTDDAVADVAEEGPSDEDDALNTDAVEEGLPLITTPFSGVPGGSEIETLEILNADIEHADNDVIMEREGVHYISDDVLSPSPEFAATLNREFKELVDEVTK